MVDVVVQPQTNKIVVIGESTASPVVVESSTSVQVPAPSRPTVEVQPTQFDVVLTTGGIQGEPGLDGDKHYRHVQGAAAITWAIDHPLDKYPAVSVVDSGGTLVEGNVLYESPSRVIITFTAAFAGQAFLN